MRTIFFALLVIICHLSSYCHGFRLPKSYRTPKYALQMSEVESTSAVSGGTGGATILSCSGLSKSWVGTPQFEDISLKIGKGQRLGLIGVNGAGKSTLLKCLGKIDSADAGTIETSSNTNVIYVDQEPDWKGISVYEALFGGTDLVAKSVRDYYRCMDPAGEMDNDEFAKVTDDMSESNGWDYQSQGLSIAEKLNIPDEYLYRDVNSLSGGERKRVGLSAALLKQPDILLLDEPTNHLDIDALDWLADFLRPGGKGKDKDMAMLLVTHDRYFLERVCSEIVELDRGSVYRYPGNYGRYLELKAERLNAEDAESQRAKTKLRRESEWMAKQPQGRQRKSKARQDQFYDLVEAAKNRELVKKVEFMSQEEKDKQKRLGGVVSEFRNAKYMMGDRTLLEGFTYNFRARDRIGIVGPNGVGKSTFLKVLTGQLELASGSVRLGDTVSIGYYEQTGLVLTAEQENQPVLKFVQEAVDRQSSISSKADFVKPAEVKITVNQGAKPTGRRDRLKGKEGSMSMDISESGGGGTSVAVNEQEAMKLLTRFQFPSKRWYDKLGQLSGGERRRLQLLQVLATSPNVLLLDEPSNDLDLATLQALEDYLTNSFEGCLVVVSHDNFFVNAVAEHLFVFEGDGVVRDFQGSYTDYLEYRKDKIYEEKQDEKAAASSRASASSFSSSPIASPASLGKSAPLSSSDGESKLSYNEKKELGKVEKEVSKLEGQVEEMEAKVLELGSSGAGYSELAEWQAKADKLKEKLAVKEGRWMELLVKEA